MATRLDDQSLTLSEVLDLPAVRLAQPRVLTSMARVATTPVSWVHVCEQPDMTDFVDADHLVLTSGIALGRDESGWERMVDALGAKRASGIVVELRVAIDAVPETLVARAEAMGLTFIVLDRPARFVDVTQSVHREIAQRQVLELERTAVAHETFTRLTVESASSQDIVDAVSLLTEAPVVLEDVNRRVLAFRSLHAPQTFLAEWDRADKPTGGSGRFRSISIRADGAAWGRLFIGETALPEAFVSMVAERAAAAIAFSYSQATGRRLMGQDAQQRLMSEILAGGAHGDIRASLEAYDIPVDGAALIPGIVGVAPDQSAMSMTIGWENAIAEVGVSGIIAERRPGTRHFLASAPAGRPVPDVLRSLATALHAQGVVSPVAYGDVVSDVRSLLGAFESAEYAFAETPFQSGHSYLTPGDMGAGALFSLLGTDPRLRAFVQRRLGPLLELAASDRDRLLASLRSYLEAGRNIAAASRELHVSRPALYARLRRIGDLLDVDVERRDDAVALHIALRAHEVIERVHS